MKIDFYNKLKDRLDSLIENCSGDRNYSIRVFKSMNKSLSVFLDDNFNILDEDKKNFYSGTLISFKNYQMLYVKDRLNSNIHRLFLNDGENAIQIDNYFDRINQDDTIVESNKSIIYVNGKIKNKVLSIYNKTLLYNEMVYESVVSSSDEIDLDLVRNNSSDVIEISYFLGEALNGKINNAIIGNSVINSYIDLASSKLDYVFDFFDNFELKNKKVKVK